MEDRVQQFGRPDWGLGRQVSLGAICGSHRAAWKAAGRVRRDA
jgi:hypothetical protein